MFLLRVYTRVGARLLMSIFQVVDFVGDLAAICWCFEMLVGDWVRFVEMLPPIFRLIR